MKITKHGLLGFVAVLTVAFSLSGSYATATAVAHDEHNHDHEPATAETRISTQDQSDTKATTAERRTAANEKLTAAKLKACEKHQAAIKNRMTRISERATKHLDLFTTISERAQTFYTNKGNAVTNYDELVATVEAKKTAAESAVSSISTATTRFTCDGANPKQAVEEFRTSLKSSITALKEYRTSVKNLIVGIKSVNGERTTTNSAEDAQ